MSRSLEAWPGCPCLDCGKKSPDVTLTADHMLPQCIVGSKVQRREILPQFYISPKNSNSLCKVVYDVSNLFPLCEDCHIQVDAQKTAAFLSLPSTSESRLSKEQRIQVNENLAAPNRGNPVALILALYDYPITDNRQYFGKQKRKMRFVLNRFIKATRKLPGGYDERLLQRYQDAAIEARDLGIWLRDLKEPAKPYVCNIDLTSPRRRAESVSVHAFASL